MCIPKQPDSLPTIFKHCKTLIFLYNVLKWPSPVSFCVISFFSKNLPNKSVVFSRIRNSLPTPYFCYKNISVISGIELEAGCFEEILPSSVIRFWQVYGSFLCFKVLTAKLFTLEKPADYQLVANHTFRYVILSNWFELRSHPFVNITYKAIVIGLTFSMMSFWCTQSEPDHSQIYQWFCQVIFDIIPSSDLNVDCLKVTFF